jgi:hypothetical protein
MSLRSGSGGPAALPVQSTVAETYRHVAGNLRAIAYLAALPAAVRLGAELFAAVALSSPPTVLARLAMLLLTAMLLAVFAVGWQRFTLLGEFGRSSPWQFVFERREGQFLLYFLVLMAPVTLAMLSALAAPEGGSLLPPLLMGIGFFLFVRLSLVLPAVSVDGEAGLGRAWQLSQGQFWRLAGVLVLVSLPAEMASLLVLLVLSGDALLAKVLARVIGVGLEFLIFAITMTALAFSYRWLAGPPASAAVLPGPGGGQAA